MAAVVLVLLTSGLAFAGHARPRHRRPAPVVNEPPATPSASDTPPSKRERADHERDRERYASAERERLRQKFDGEPHRPDPEVATLKAKLQRDDAADAAQREADLLKLKSEQMPREKAAALRATLAHDERAAQPAPPLPERPIAHSAPRRQATRIRPPIEECSTIGWWRGYVKSQFTAVARTAP